MNNVITLTRHEFSSSDLLDLAKKERRPWMRRRIRAIALLRDGTISREAIARKLGTDSDRLRIWIRRYNTRGLSGLEDIRGRGRRRAITPRQEASVQRVLQADPRKAGIPTTLWTGRAVQEYLAKQHWFSCSIAEAYVIIHRLGFTLQRPGRSPIEANPRAERQFLRELRGEKRMASSCSIPGGR